MRNKQIKIRIIEKQKSPFVRGLWVVCGRFELSTSSV